MPGPKSNEREGTRALLRSAPMSAYKVREVLDLIRDQPVERAAEILKFCDRGAADVVAKVLNSAVANAAANDELPNPEELFVAACFADEGKTARRMRPRARGRASRIRKRSSHITIIVARMPEDRLRRVRAHQEAEQAARRVRRLGGRAGGGTRRARAGGAPAPAPVVEDAVAEDIVDADVDDALPEETVSSEAEAALVEEETEETAAGEEVAAAEAAPEDAAAEEAATEEAAGEDAAGTTEAGSHQPKEES
ncbi:MAG TPA: 50S ribosomal protein L22 [Acidimicrobiales bacterium]|nr:50S ribosomal protein L22 [Acidimicrobiales bacterium]